MFDHHYNMFNSSKVSSNKMSEDTIRIMTQKIKINSQTGFSIVELLITIAMVAVLIGVGAPAFVGMSQENTLVESSNRFVSSIALTRSEAVSRNELVAMCQLNDAGTACDVDGNWHDGWVIWADLDNDNTMDIGPNDQEILHSEAALPAGYTLIATNNQFRNRITFNSNGEATGDGGNLLEVFRLCDPQANDNIARIIYLNGVGHSWINRTRGLTAGLAVCP